jgi:hypothetical protein
MKPLEAFLASLHPEALQMGKTLLDGQEIEYGRPNNAVIKRLVREHYHKGQEELKKFNRWLVRSQGLKQNLANRATATVWNAACMTYDDASGKANPEGLLDRNDGTYTYYTKATIAHALKLWAQYTKDSPMYERVTLWLKRKPDKVPQYVLEALEKSPPYTRVEYRRLLKALEEFKDSPRFPWAWSCLRLTFTQGVTLSEVVRIERARVYSVISQNKPLMVVGAGLSRHVVQVALVEEELRYLLSFPFQWGVIGDLVDPTSTHRDVPHYSLSPLQRVVKLIFARAKVPICPKWILRVRWSAAWQYYQKSKNLVGAAQILGHKNVKRTLEFLKELQKREAALKASEAVVETEEVAEETD